MTPFNTQNTNQCNVGDYVIIQIRYDEQISSIYISQFYPEHDIDSLHVVLIKMRIDRLYLIKVWLYKIIGMTKTSNCQLLHRINHLQKYRYLETANHRRL